MGHQTSTAVGALLAMSLVGLNQRMETSFDISAYFPDGAEIIQSTAQGIPSGIPTDVIAAFGRISAKQAPTTIASFKSERVRPTTPHEQLVGELRSMALHAANWDKEGGAAPIESSFARAIEFVYAMGPQAVLPEPMLLASGRAGLFWEVSSFYADLEFYGDGKVTYFVDRPGEVKGRGVAVFNGRNVPPVFGILLA
jgi:hypothetical protein